MYKKGTHISNKEHIQFNHKQVFLSFTLQITTYVLSDKHIYVTDNFFPHEKKLKLRKFNVILAIEEKIRL